MSAILSADDLNDFISPGVACIKPVETLPKEELKEPNNAYEVTTEDKVPPPPDAPPAQISLTDCLACSGCVTSAEAVLVSLQSHSEVLNALDSTPSIDPQLLAAAARGEQQNGLGEGRIFIVSISPQTRASLAAAYGISEQQAGYMLEQLFSGPQGIRSGGAYKNGFTWVIDTNVAREACLVLGADEVKESLAQSSSNEQAQGDNPTHPKRPILTSACPGWICYAEKTHPHILPHLSRLKSPQALLGTLLKTSLSKRLNISPDRIWHLAVMPCFDKKLEASREELTDLAWQTDSQSQTKQGIRDVDCVITTKEILMLAESRGIALHDVPRTPLDPSTRVPFPDPTLDSFLFPSLDHPRHRNAQSASGPSGGYLYHILCTYQAQSPGSSIEIVRGRNSDVVDYTLKDANGGVILKTARYYGFRNIQNLVRRLKPARASRMPGAAARRLGGASRKPGMPAAASSASSAGLGTDYAYVEVMACPGGCTNGGAQLKPIDLVASSAPAAPATSNGGANADLGLDSAPTSGTATPIASSGTSTPQQQREWLARVDEAYFSASDDEGEGETVGTKSNGTAAKIAADNVNGISPAYIHSMLTHWSNTTSVPLDRLAYTTYRKVESDVGKDRDKGRETERVVELAGKIGGGW
ncbi:cytosolic Fe-S cluster assembly factor nar1 [Xylona heveae TC161]|uniref:Nuclear architecture-related protein 1 n=1 Tax=Xylona heveae (strain CBS 132557 / TC161) TaxID=1328760 RepID=A0A165GJL1_XYLHT|nr:cytosolic Fe-S cluster assembly factor nar1 [Xylona heveae TC161]KZF22269.1 cytosolic Fe-S cluster assembly factor nar1 [Xylona heveae TC161]